MVIVFAAARRIASFGVAAVPGHADPWARAVIEPSFLQGPSEAELGPLLLARAEGQDVDARAILMGRVGCDQALLDLRIVREAPEGSAFGRAMLASAPFWRFSPRTVDGRPTDDGLVRLTAIWMALPSARALKKRPVLASDA